MRQLLLLLAFSAIIQATVDQSYVQDVARDGASNISKLSELSIFSTQLEENDFRKMKSVCDSGAVPGCLVDVAKKTVRVEQGFEPGGYYTYETEYGLLEVTHTLTIRQVPNDKFAGILAKILITANVTDPSQETGSVAPIDFEDVKNNHEAASILKAINANLSYTVNMPYDIAEAGAGNVTGKTSGKSVIFDIVEILEDSRPIVIKSRELNL